MLASSVTSDGAPKHATGAAAKAPAGARPPLDLISHFIELEIEARSCSELEGLRFAIVNSTRRIAAFEQAVLAEPARGGGWQITRASGVSMVEAGAPLVRALTGWLSHPRNAEVLTRGECRQADLAADARAWGLEETELPAARALWVPIRARDGGMLAGVLAVRREPWAPRDLALLVPLAGAYGHAWEALLPQGGGRQKLRQRLTIRRWLAAGLVATAALLALVRVPMSAFAPAEVVSAEPILVTAPIDGVVGELPLAPGTWVEKDSIVLRFVDVKLRNDVEVASRNVAVAQARHFRIMQSATAGQKDAQDLASTKAELDVARAELDYARELLTRSVVRAGAAGLLIYAAKSDWLGKPVSIGERVMEIGDPARAVMRIELPVSDAIALKPGSSVALFLDGDPLNPIRGTLVRISYRPAMSPDQQLVYRVIARFDDGEARRLGLRGIARVSGDDVSFWFYLFRRPIAALRQRLGI